MSIKTEFINFIVPIATIRAKYPGGWERCILDHTALLQGRCWHDDYLFRNGAMNPMDMKSLVEHWQEMGFAVTKEVNGQTKWADFCVYEGLFGSAYECEWLVEIPDGTVAHIYDPYPEIIKHLPKRG
jgi:hypothetical protein